MVDSKGCERQHLPGGTGENHETSVGIVGRRAEIYIRDFANTKQKGQPLNRDVRFVLTLILKFEV
jgi:hypothetical protein